MNIADRIQTLRKSKGISQEQLADQIGVSRQAVSKWESEQSTPDLEKVILMSDFFDVTTDYILKGIEPVSGDEKNEKPDARIFSITGTAFTLMGIVVSAVVWYEEQSAVASASGLILLIMGCMIHGIGLTVSDRASAGRARMFFVKINLWVLPFVPLSLVLNILLGGRGPAPYPVLSSAKFILFLAVYLAIGITGTLALRRTSK